MKVRLLLVADQNMWHRSLDKLFEAPAPELFRFDMGWVAVTTGVIV